jgi:hypothetical protein
MEQPVFYYEPDIAPSGMIFHTSKGFPRWKNDIFIGSLIVRYLARLVVEGDHVIHEERLLQDRGWKIRARGTGWFALHWRRWRFAGEDLAGLEMEPDLAGRAPGSFQLRELSSPEREFARRP